MIKGFLFDLDGVITDTANYHYLAWKHLADEIGVPFDSNRNEALRGVSRRQSLLILLGNHAATEKQLLEWMDRKNGYYQALLKEITESDILPGVKQFLIDLKRIQFKVGLASASKNAREVIERLNINQYLDTISDGYSVDQPKPAPDLFLHAAHALDLKPETCVVVEDAEAGITAGIAAGMKTIGIGPANRVGAATLVLEKGFENTTVDFVLDHLQ